MGRLRESHAASLSRRIVGKRNCVALGEIKRWQRKMPFSLQIEATKPDDPTRKKWHHWMAQVTFASLS
jgi:hypothetical protein